MQNGILFILLIICGLEDWKRKEVTVAYIVLFGAVGVILQFLEPSCSVGSIVCGVLLGAALAGLSILSRGSIGMGDGILIAVTGIYLGGIRNLELLLTGLFLAGMWSFGLLVTKKKTRKEKIAFMPFLLAAYVYMMVR